MKIPKLWGRTWLAEAIAHGFFLIEYSTNLVSVHFDVNKLLYHTKAAPDKLALPCLLYLHGLILQKLTFVLSFDKLFHSSVANRDEKNNQCDCWGWVVIFIEFLICTDTQTYAHTYAHFCKPLKHTGMCKSALWRSEQK